jgi:hypothetical protein
VARFVLILIVLCHYSLLAQPSFGIKCGTTFANHRFNDRTNLSFDPGHHFYYRNLLRPYVGGYVEIKINSAVSFQTEVAYLGLGHRFRSVSNSLYNYLGVPFGLRYSDGKVGISAGAYASYFLDHDKSAYRRWDAGVHAGIEYLIVERAGIGVRYICGLLDLYRPDVETTFAQYDKVNNRGLQLYLYFPLVKEGKLIE